MEEEKKGMLSDRVRRAIEEYEREQAEGKPPVEVKPKKEEKKEKKNFVLELWDKLGKTGQVITLVAGILTGLTTIKPYAMDVWDFGVKFVHSIENTEDNTEKIKMLEKYKEVITSILKMELYEYWHTNPDGKKVKLFKTREVHGKHMTYYFDKHDFPWVVNLNVESGKWYYIDGTGVYFEI